MQNIDHDSLQISMFSNGISELKLVYPQPTFLSYHSIQVQFPLPVFKQMLLVIFWIICMLIFNNKIKKCSKRRAFPTPLSTRPPGLSPKITMVNSFLCPLALQAFPQISRWLMVSSGMFRGNDYPQKKIQWEISAPWSPCTESWFLSISKSCWNSECMSLCVHLYAYMYGCTYILWVYLVVKIYFWAYSYTYMYLNSTCYFLLKM